MLEFHEYADIFPLLEGAALAELAADIEANGLREPIVLLDGKILDGRNRYRALVAGGIIPDADAHPESSGMFQQFAGPWAPQMYEGLDPLTFVVSKNIHRRHLTTSQRAMLAAEIEGFRHGGDRRSAAGPDQAANLHLDRQHAAERHKVSERYVATAAEVRDHGVPDLKAAVRRGDLTVNAAAAIATLEPAEQDAVMVKVGSPEFDAEVKRRRAEAQAAKKAKRQAREVDLGAKQRALPDARFGVIYADPPWRFEVRSRDTGMDRAADNHYPTMDLPAIAQAVPAWQLAAEDCVLFCWATAPMLLDGLALVKAWGFTYRSHLVWDKIVNGTGYWFRSRHEILLVATRGNPPAPAMGTQAASVLAATPGRHSEKPVAAYEMIEAYFPSLPKIELFARGSRPGWTAWGLEAPVAGDGDQGSGVGSATSSEAFDAGEKVSTGDEAGAGPTPGPSPRGGGEQEQIDPEDVIDGAEPAAPPSPTASPLREGGRDVEPVAAAVISAGLVHNAYVLGLNRAITNPQPELPSRLFQFPIEYVEPGRMDASQGRLLVCHPLLVDHSFVRRVAEETGVDVVWHPHDEFGRDRGAQGRWWHAVDLCNDEHAGDLWETRQYTDERYMLQAVSHGLRYGRLSVGIARDLLHSLKVVEPTDRSRALLAGDALRPCEYTGDGSRKRKKPRWSINADGQDDPAAEAWLWIHGVEDGWFDRDKGGYLWMSAQGLARRAEAEAVA